MPVVQRMSEIGGLTAEIFTKKNKVLYHGSRNIFSSLKNAIAAAAAEPRGPLTPTFDNSLFRLKTKRINNVYEFIASDLLLDGISLAKSLFLIKTLPLSSMMPIL